MEERESKIRNTIHALIHTGHLHRRVMEKHLESTGVYSSQHRLLMHIAKNKDFSQKQLADHFQVSTATIAVMLKKLEKGGFVERVMDETDNRIKKISITSKGEEVVKMSEQIFREVDSGMFEGFDQEDLEVFHGYLEKIIKNVNSKLT